MLVYCDECGHEFDFGSIKIKSKWIDKGIEKKYGYDNEFGEKEHLLLRDKLKNLKGKFLLTINDHPKVREWYKDFNIEEVQVNYSVCKESKGRGKFNELIIKN